MARILVIDDDPNFVEATKVVLESKGHKVISASSGKEGLDKTREKNPDLIILDIMMEKTDTGFNVCRELKKDRKCKHIPILMLTSIEEKTGIGFKEDAGDEVWLPVDDYYDKPLEPEELLSKVEILLKKK